MPVVLAKTILGGEKKGKSRLFQEGGVRASRKVTEPKEQKKGTRSAVHRRKREKVGRKEGHMLHATVP